MIYLDTHTALWLYEGYFTKFNKSTLKIIEENSLVISAMSLAELQILYEIKRTTFTADEIILHLKQAMDLNICNLTLADIVIYANKLSWTRDPFDRLIVANAMVKNRPLITKDKIIHKHYKHAIW